MEQFRWPLFWIFPPSQRDHGSKQRQQREPHMAQYMLFNNISERRIPIAGRLRRPQPQAKVKGFGAETASTRAQHGKAASGPDTRGKGLESVQTASQGWGQGRL